MRWLRAVGCGAPSSLSTLLPGGRGSALEVERPRASTRGRGGTSAGFPCSLRPGHGWLWYEAAQANSGSLPKGLSRRRKRRTTPPRSNRESARTYNSAKFLISAILKVPVERAVWIYRESPATATVKQAVTIGWEASMRGCTQESTNRGVRVVQGVAILTVLSLLVLAPGAVAAQTYQPGQGPLTVSSSTPEPGDEITMTGEGFGPSVVVDIQLVPNAGGSAIPLGEATTDSNGRFSASVVIPDTLVAGVYRLQATGLAPDGGTMILSADLSITQVLSEGVQEDGETTDTTVAAPTTSAPDTEAVAGEEEDGSGGTAFPYVLVGAGLFIVVVGGTIWWRFRAANR